MTRIKQLHHQVEDMCKASHMCELSLLGGPQVAAIVIDGLAWKKMVWAQPSFSLSLKSVEEDMEVTCCHRHSLALFCIVPAASKLISEP